MSGSAPSSAERVAWLDGELVAEAAARIPATSSTALSGVGAFETIRIARGAAPLWERHRTRLERACAELDLPLPGPDWQDAFAALARHHAAADGVARITVGDGFLLITWRPLPAELERERREGVALRAVEHARELPAFKTTSRAALVGLERRAGGEVLLARRGELLETSRSNLFLHRDGVLWTAPADRVLPGVARGWVLERARARGIAVVEQPPARPPQGSPADLFLSNAVRGIRRVAALDGGRLELAPQALSAQLQGDFDRLLDPD